MGANCSTYAFLQTFPPEVLDYIMILKRKKGKKKKGFIFNAFISEFVGSKSVLQQLSVLFNTLSLLVGGNLTVFSLWSVCGFYFFNWACVSLISDKTVTPVYGIRVHQIGAFTLKHSILLGIPSYWAWSKVNVFLNVSFLGKLTDHCA